MAPEQTSRTKRFFQLFIAHQSQIYTFILMLVPNKADAEDILQETSAVMWEKFDQFDPDTDFTKWAQKIAYYKILNFRSKKKNARVYFSDDLMEVVLNQAVSDSRNVDARLEALRTCIKKLRSQDQDLIQKHYEDGITIKRIAEKTNRSVLGLYKVMGRIYCQLSKCVVHEIKALDS